jgi:hypothetical protein
LPVSRSLISTPASIGTRGSSATAIRRVGEELLWEIDEHAWFFVEPNAKGAGAGRITLAVTGSTGCSRASPPGASSMRRSRYSNGVRHVKVPDPDGNAIAFAEPPDVEGESDSDR